MPSASSAWRSSPSRTSTLAPLRSTSNTRTSRPPSSPAQARSSSTSSAPSPHSPKPSTASTNSPKRSKPRWTTTIFSSHGESLEEVVLLNLGLRNLTLATAESCTGGLLAQRLTAIPGSSRYFLGGAVVYSDALKTTFANVPAELVATKGPVSPEVARSLAEGIRSRTGASLGISITGIAGPGPGAPGPDAEKPIGLVYIALADAQDTQVKQFNLLGDRERIRWWASQHALELIRHHLL